VLCSKREYPGLVLFFEMRAIHNDNSNIPVESAAKSTRLTGASICTFQAVFRIEF
jgi:hypothetical protein